MAADIKPACVAAEARRVLVGPGDAAAHLLRHGAQIAARLADGDEVEHHVMRARVDEHLGGKGIVLGFAAEPGAAVNEHEHRRVRAPGAVDVELLARTRAVRCAQRLAQAPAHRLAPRRERRVETLIVGRVELDLVVIQKYARPLLVGRRSDVALLRQRRRGDRAGHAGERRAAADVFHFRGLHCLLPARMNGRLR